MFNKDTELFPSTRSSYFLSHCAVSPLYRDAAHAMHEFNEKMAHLGLTALDSFADLLPRYRRGFGTLLKTEPGNISYTHTTAEAMNQIAWGYPFAPGDRIISYRHEYPSNHYPWLLQHKRGVILDLLPDTARAPGFAPGDKPSGWNMDDLVRLCTERTRVVALSHVQFASGFAADLRALGAFCKERDIDLIIDCAQSLGCLPVYPEEMGISAVAASGWKWLLGPKGSGVLYTSQALRDKLSPPLGGPSMMRQQTDYLDLNWQPFTDGRMFEYSTMPWDHIAALVRIVEDIFTRYAMEDIRDEVFRLQDLFLSQLDSSLFAVQRFDDTHRSGIVSMTTTGESKEMVRNLGAAGVVISERGGYLRLAPHFYQSDEQIVEAAAICNRIAAGQAEK
jgi:cysteine desulfurase/selenocysteine lyase